MAGQTRGRSNEAEVTKAQAERTVSAEQTSQAELAHRQAEVRAKAAAKALRVPAGGSHRYELHNGDGPFLRVGRNFDERVVRQLFAIVCSTPKQVKRLAEAELSGEAERAAGARTPQAEKATAERAAGARTAQAEKAERVTVNR